MMTTAFAAYPEESEYASAVDRYLSHAGTVPVLTADRPDLTASVTSANALYMPSTEPAREERRYLRVEGDVSEPLLRLASALPPGECAIDEPPEVLVGTYAELSYGAGDTPPPRILTGRDQQSLSWMVAKQLSQPRPGLPDLIVSDLDDGAPIDGYTWIGPDEMQADLDENFSHRVAGGPWRRALFHGNGATDSSNLGLHTLCGRFAPTGRRPTGYGPSCHFGQGCYKPERGIIPVGQIRATELALLNCFSGAAAPAALYSADYNLLLAAIDGPAQRIIFTMTACDAGRPEIIAWAEQQDGAVTRMERSLADINPFPALAQVGIG